MRVLYFSPRECWPITCGANLRDYYLARALQQRAGVTYAGLTAWYDGKVWHGKQGRESEIDSVLVRRSGAYSVSNIVRGVVGPLPLTLLNFRDAVMREQLRELLDEADFDIVQIEGVHLFSYLPILRAAAKRSKIVCDWHNIESEVLRRYSETEPNGFAKRLYARRTAVLVERLENAMLADCDAHLVCSERERRILSERNPRARIIVVPNGVEYAYQSAMQQTLPIAARHDVVFVGSMNYHANVDAVLDFANRTLPTLQNVDPMLRFVVVGAHPAPEILALQDRPGILVTGTVDDVRPYYQTAAAVVVPLRVGGGTRLKVIEAMAAGVPVISTRLGVEGLDVADGQDVVLADTPEQFAAALRFVTKDHATWTRLASAGQETARTRYDWSQIGERLYDFYNGLTSNAQSMAV